MSLDGLDLLKSGRAVTLSEKSSISYQIALSSESDLVIRVSENSGPGHYSDEWISLEGIYRTLESFAPNRIFSSQILRPLFKSKGANTPTFMMAALLDLGLVKRSDAKARFFIVGDTQAFIESLQSLMNKARKK